MSTLGDADIALTSRTDAGPPLSIRGLEPVVSGAIAALGARDWWVPGPRERAGAVLRDVPVERLVDAARGARSYAIAPVSYGPADRALYAVGLAIGTGRTALVHLGVGGASDGAFHEALNLAALHAAPVIFLVAVDTLGAGAPLGPQLSATPSSLAAAHGIATLAADGGDADSINAAVVAAKAAGGPHLIEAQLPTHPTSGESS